jgi:hypothetical protein
MEEEPGCRSRNFSMGENESFIEPMEKMNRAQTSPLLSRNIREIELKTNL